jgi:hypothetical protein
MPQAYPLRGGSAAAFENNRARTYDPRVGRWTSQDPLGLRPDSNPYRYVGNAPTDGIDPFGLEKYEGWKYWEQDPTYKKKKEDTPNWTIQNEGKEDETRRTPGKKDGPLGEEGPYMRTKDEYEAFRMAIEYRTLDKDPVTPPEQEKKFEHYGNSGVYIFNRYEVQIVDPFRWGVKQGATIKDQEDGKEPSKRNQLLPGGVYMLDPPNGKPEEKFINWAKDFDEKDPEKAWNKLEIEFYPPKKEDDKWLPAEIKTKLNGHPIWEGPIKQGDKAATGTGKSRSMKTDYVTKGYIFLQSHWGSQVEFRNPVIETLPPKQ